MKVAIVALLLFGCSSRPLDLPERYDLALCPAPADLAAVPDLVRAAVDCAWNFTIPPGDGQGRCVVSSGPPLVVSLVVDGHVVDIESDTASGELDGISAFCPPPDSAGYLTVDLSTWRLALDDSRCTPAIAGWVERR